MVKSVIVCEKSLQIKEIKAAVGNEYGPIFPARGHILTLKEPHEVREDWEDWSTELLWPGEFYPKKPVKDTKHLLSDIRNAIANAEQVIIATDPDREGQVIGDEILEFLKYDGRVMRALFTAVDPVSMRKSFENMKPNSHFKGRYMAGQAREQADQITNLSLTRAATVALKAPGGKGAIGVGRVKSPVLGIVCKREEEIKNFKPQDMFEIDAQTTVANGGFKLTCARLPSALVKENEPVEEESDADDLESGEEALEQMDPLRGKIVKRDIAEGLAAAAKGHKGPVSAKFEKKKQGPPKLFDLTTLQSACSARFGWSAEHTLNMTQSLYAAPHHILTYPRAEAQYLPESEIPNMPELIESLVQMNKFGNHAELLSSPRPRKGKSGHFSDKGLEGFSHFAIIPNINTAKDFNKIWPKLDDDQKKLFDLVARQYMAAMAPDFEYRQTTVEMTVPWKGHNWSFRNSGRVPLVLGWKEILGSGAAKSENDMFPALKNGEAGEIINTEIRTVTTKPPVRYTEGALIKVMKQAWRLVDDPKHKARLKEATGIGTPSTRAEVVKGLFKQAQIVRAGKSVKPSEGGMQLYKILDRVCPNVVDPGRTAIWETIFDSVEANKMDARDAVSRIIETTRVELKKISASTEKISLGGNSKPTPKMLAAARNIAKRNNIKLPAGLVGDSEKCRLFLNEHLGERPKNADGSPAPYPPSDKQRAMAENLAQRLDTEIPEETLQSSKELSTWIDKAIKKAPPPPPSPKQLAFAEKLASDRGIELTEKITGNMKACSDFIDEQTGGGKKPGGKKAGGKAQGYGDKENRAPTEKQLAFAEKLASDNSCDLPDNARKSMKECSDFIDKYMKQNRNSMGPS